MFEFFLRSFIKTSVDLPFKALESTISKGGDHFAAPKGLLQDFLGVFFKFQSEI